MRVYLSVYMFKHFYLRYIHRPHSIDIGAPLFKNQVLCTKQVQAPRYSGYWISCKSDHPARHGKSSDTLHAGLKPLYEQKWFRDQNIPTVTYIARNSVQRADRPAFELEAVRG